MRQGHDEILAIYKFRHQLKLRYFEQQLEDYSGLRTQWLNIKNDDSRTIKMYDEWIGNFTSEIEKRQAQIKSIDNGEFSLPNWYKAFDNMEFGVIEDEFDARLRVLGFDTHFSAHGPSWHHDGIDGMFQLLSIWDEQFSPRVHFDWELKSKRFRMAVVLKDELGSITRISWGDWLFEDLPQLIMRTFMSYLDARWDVLYSRRGNGFSIEKHQHLLTDERKQVKSPLGMIDSLLPKIDYTKIAEEAKKGAIETAILASMDSNTKH